MEDEGNESPDGTGGKTPHELFQDRGGQRHPAIF